MLFKFYLKSKCILPPILIKIKPAVKGSSLTYYEPTLSIIEN
jgi:hypothetical protein